MVRNSSVWGAGASGGDLVAVRVGGDLLQAA